MKLVRTRALSILSYWGKKHKQSVVPGVNFFKHWQNF